MCTLVLGLVILAAQKLMLAFSYHSERPACSLALLAQRFGLDIVFGHPKTVKYVEMLVANHMCFCISMTED
jgi:hypothetical protein